MILIIKEDLVRDQHEDNSYVKYVLEIKPDARSLGMTPDDIFSAYKSHITELMHRAGITVNPNYLSVIMKHSEVKDKKLHKQILNDNGFIKWLGDNYYVKDHLTFDTVNIINNIII